MADYTSQFTGQEIDSRLAKVPQLESGLAGKQATLVSGQNIKTLNGESILGGGNITIQGGDPDTVKYVSQTLTESQKAQARANIDAASLSDIADMDFVTATTLPTASASTMGHIYLIGPDANDNYDRYFTQESGGSYSWVPLGSTQIDLSTYATQEEVSQLEAEVNDRLLIIKEDGFAVADGEGNAVVRYDANGFDVAMLSSHLIELIKGVVDVNIINVDEDGFFIADGNYNVAASVSDSGLDAAGLATNLANIILALVGSPSYKVSCDVGFLPYFGLWNQSSEDSLCLCALKTPIVDDKIPFHEGFLFHKLPNDDKSFWFGTRLDNAVQIGVADFYPKDYLIAMSPTDGRVIAVKRWVRDNIKVWDGTNTTTVSPVSSDGNNRKPMGWLYNSGVDFIVENGTEYCIFAEYDGAPGTGKGGYYVWKGRYPYTQASDWKTTFHQDFQYSGVIQDNTVTHFHQIRRDPWTNILYLTSGDQPGQLKWWYSTDYGDTWVLLTDNKTNGWEEHCCRLINFIFTEDYIYWATDHGTNHTLNRIRRNASTGIIDPSTREKLCDLPFAQACNSLCLVESPHGILMYERFDVGDEYAPYFDGKVKILFWSLTENRLYTIAELRLQEGETWGGCRGKCYVNYTSGQEGRPAMGYADNTRCTFDLVGAGDNIGTIMFNL